MPCALFFSGCRPPDRASHEVILHTLPDQAFMEEIVKLGGTPVDVFRNKGAELRLMSFVIKS